MPRRQTQSNNNSCGGIAFGILVLIVTAAYIITVVMDILTATWPVLLGLALAVLAGYLVPLLRGDFIGLRVLKPGSWFYRGARKAIIFMAVMLGTGLAGYAPARHVQLVQEHQEHLREVARQEALERERRAEEARQTALKAQQEHEERLREAERKRQEAETERLRVVQAQAKAKRQAEEERQRAIEQAQRDQKYAAQEAERSAERELKARQREEAKRAEEEARRLEEEARRLEEGRFTSNEVEDMCWTAIKAKAAEQGILATSGSNWGNYPHRWMVTTSWKWIPKVKLLSFDGEAVARVECVVQDSGSVSTYFFRD